jgi:hypothetical protein
MEAGADKRVWLFPKAIKSGKNVPQSQLLKVPLSRLSEYFSRKKTLKLHCLYDTEKQT